VGDRERDRPVRVEGANVILRPIRPDEEDLIARAGGFQRTIFVLDVTPGSIGA
jgi:hypothetical protein